MVIGISKGCQNPFALWLQNNRWFDDYSAKTLRWELFSANYYHHDDQTNKCADEYAYNLGKSQVARNFLRNADSISTTETARIFCATNCSIFRSLAKLVV